MVVFKSVVESLKEHNPAYKRRGAHLRVPTGDLESALEPQWRLVAAVKEVAEELLQSFDLLRKAQRVALRASQAYLGFDTDGIDESALALLQAAASCFDACEEPLAKNGLREVVAACERIGQDFQQVNTLIKDRDEAHREFEHYNEKVAGFLATPQKQQTKSERDRLDRNQEKLLHAQRIADEKRRICDAAVRTVVGHRNFHARATLHAALRSYVAALATVGDHARPVAQAFHDELQPGTPVEVTGFPEQSGVNGLTGVVQSVLSAGQFLVAVPGDEGPGKAVRGEHLLPLGPAVVDDSAAEASPDEPGVQVTPAAAPRGAGCEALVTSKALPGAVSDVLVGGREVEILEVTSKGVRVRIPPGQAPGPMRVEVRRSGWQEYVASCDGAFSFYEALSFGSVCGRNIELAAGAAGLPSIARRREGLLHGIAITAQPIPDVLGAGPAPRGRRRYFEVDVLEVAERRMLKTLWIGFVWPQSDTNDSTVASGIFAGDPTSSSSAPPCASFGRWLPETADDLRNAFIVGGDPPKVRYLDGEASKVAGWRPIREVVVGSTLGALLEEDGDEISLTVYQDGLRRCSTSASSRGFGAGAPHGLVDVCGSVVAVELKQGAVPPATPRADEAEGDAGDPAEPQRQVSGEVPPPLPSGASFEPPTRRD